MKWIFLAAALCMTSFSANAFTARVLWNHDGDTVTVETLNGNHVKVRLADLDAPELDQPYGQLARSALCDLICGKTVEIDDRGLDRYGRTIGVIHAPVNVNEEMVREGMAWDYVRYDDDPIIPGLEQHARAGGIGLWRDPSPIPPWEWRHFRSR